MCARNEDVLGRETTRLQRQEGSPKKKPVKRHQKEKDEVRRFIGHHTITRAKSLHSPAHQTTERETAASQSARSAYSAPIQTKSRRPWSSDLIFNGLCYSCSLSLSLGAKRVINLSTSKG